jgi:hypothetical protein
MNFSLVCLIGIFTTVPFGAAFLLTPEAVGAQYGLSGWNAGTLVVARLLGATLLYAAGALVAVRNTTDVRIQKNIATFFALASVISAAVSVQAVTSGVVNAIGWSTVAIYAFFTVAWASLALRKAY